MPRVLPLGHILPQSAFVAFQSVRILEWSLILQFQQWHQCRVLSDVAFKFPKQQELKNTNKSQEDVIEAEDPQDDIFRPGWKARLFRQESLQKHIRPLRRRPPKYSYTAEPLINTPAKLQVTVPPIHIHPLHRVHDNKERDAKSAPIMEDLHPPATSAPPNRQYHTRHPKVRNPDAFLRVLAKTNSASEAYAAYDMLLQITSRLVVHGADGSKNANQCPPFIIPHAHLHRLARLLSTTHPRTRSLFLRLNSVLTTLRDTGGTIFLWEWNALINCAGRGWRKTTMDDYRFALNVFKDMVVSGQSAQSSWETSIDDGKLPSSGLRPVAQPDITSFTTLLNIASRSLSEKAITHATALLDASALPWNPITHMAKLNYFIHTRQLESVREITRAAIERGLDMVTLNSCLWAYARNGQVRVALEVYELLKRNIPPEDRSDFGEANGSPLEDILREENPILNIPRFVIDTMRPNKITYNLLIQAMCYHGDFLGAMKVFRDMLSTVDPTTRDPCRHPVGRLPSAPTFYKPSITIYRAVFLGFVRHSHKKRTPPPNLVSKRRAVDVTPLPEFAARLTSSDPGTATPSQSSEPRTHWTLENLDNLFEGFLRGGWSTDGVNMDVRRPSDRMIYWIMTAYAKTTNGDIGKMYEVWRKLDGRFGYGPNGVKLWTGRIARLGKGLENRYERSNFGV